MSRGRYPRRFRAQPPSAALARRYLCHWDARELYENPKQFPDLTAESMFGEAGQLDLEIGCGTGEFLCTLAGRQPSRFFLGVDIALKPLFRAVETAAKMSLANIRFIKANIKQLYPLFAAETLDFIYLHFPVPPRKSRVWRHRIFESRFLDQACLALNRGGRISVITDQGSAFRDMLALAAADKRFRIVLDPPFSLELDDSLKSHNHAVWERRGHPVWRFELEKSQS